MRYNKELLQKIADYLQLRFPVAEFSEELGYSKGAVSNYMSGNKPVSENFIRSIENHYKIKVEDFMPGAKPMRGDLTLERTKEIAVFIAKHKDELMKDPLFRTVVESLYLREELDRLRASEGPANKDLDK